MGFIVPDSLSRVNKDEPAAVNLRKGLLVDLCSEHLKSVVYKDVVAMVSVNTHRTGS